MSILAKVPYKFYKKVYQYLISVQIFLKSSKYIILVMSSPVINGLLEHEHIYDAWWYGHAEL